ncbi:MAG TPA: hypothetical protein ENN29_02245 [Candidatus Hydrogenedentes bacterium]|nr:hypothetical protein [Candidatus Hydrogenedentota bacterium]
MIYFAVLTGVYMSLLPCCLFLVGAARKTWARPRRISRLQFEGALIAVSGMIARVIVFDPMFGRDPLRETAFAYWFSRGEAGLFAIGIILFGLGFFLERRPRPGLSPWPRRYARAAWLCALLCIPVAGLFVYKAASIGDMPWSMARAGFLWSLFAFALLYCYMAFRRPDEPLHAEDELI